MTTDEILRIVDDWVRYQMYIKDIPNLSLGIIKKGNIIFNKTYGKQSEGLVFRIASISKVFTAIAILQLCEKGKIRLDDKISKHLDWFHIKKGKEVTIRNLLTHTSGISRDGETAHWFGEDFPTIQKIKAELRNSSLYQEPEKSFKYSNLGYGILGALIEEVRGIPYSMYIRENILKVLSMNNTFIDYDDKIKDQIITGYSRKIPGVERRKMKNIKTNALAPATGFCSNVNDMSKFITALMNEDIKILRKDSYKAMKKNQAKKLKKYGESGLGLDIWNINKMNSFGHEGRFIGYSSIVGINEKEKLGVAVFTNCTDGGAFNFLQGILSIFNDLDGKNKDYPFCPNAEKYYGKFGGEWDDINVSNSDGRIMLYFPISSYPLDDAMYLKHIENHKFKIISGGQYDYPYEDAEFIFENDKIKAVKVGPNIWKKRSD
jgi:CubicO group peptidase (beta-lactamase class C family)